MVVGLWCHDFKPSKPWFSLAVPLIFILGYPGKQSWAFRHPFMLPTTALPVSSQVSDVYAEFPNFCSLEHSQLLSDPFPQSCYFRSREHQLRRHAGDNSLSYNSVITELFPPETQAEDAGSNFYLTTSFF